MYAKLYASCIMDTKIKNVKTTQYLNDISTFDLCALKPTLTNGYIESVNRLHSDPSKTKISLLYHFQSLSNFSVYSNTHVTKKNTIYLKKSQEE